MLQTIHYCSVYEGKKNTLSVFFAHSGPPQVKVQQRDCQILGPLFPLSLIDVKDEDDLLKKIISQISNIVKSQPGTIDLIVYAGDVNIGTPGGDACKFFLNGELEKQLKGLPNLSHIDITLFSTNEKIVENARERVKGTTNTSIVNTPELKISVAKSMRERAEKDDQAELANRRAPQP